MVVVLIAMRNLSIANLSVLGHPCSGQLSVSDVKLRLSHTMTNTEGGKRVSAVVQSTGKAVSDTGKVVAGGIGAAKVRLNLINFFPHLVSFLV